MHQLWDGLPVQNENVAFQGKAFWEQLCYVELRPCSGWLPLYKSWEWCALLKDPSRQVFQSVPKHAVLETTRHDPAGFARLSREPGRGCERRMWGGDAAAPAPAPPDRRAFPRPFPSGWHYCGRTWGGSNTSLMELRAPARERCGCGGAAGSSRWPRTAPRLPAVIPAALPALTPPAPPSSSRQRSPGCAAMG